jgi:hypothetical protein
VEPGFDQFPAIYRIGRKTHISVKGHELIFVDLMTRADEAQQLGFSILSMVKPKTALLLLLTPALARRPLAPGGLELQR